MLRIEDLRCFFLSRMGFEDSFACEDGKAFPEIGPGKVHCRTRKQIQPTELFPTGKKKKRKEKKKITILVWETFQSLDFVCG